MSESAGCEFTSFFSDAAPTWLGGTGGGLTTCEQASLAASEQQALVIASDGNLSSDEAGAIAQGDVTAGSQVPTPDPGCKTFADLGNQTAFTVAWFSCLQEVLSNYAIWIVAILTLVLIAVAWAYGGFR